jgi:DNA/RNA endonuclease YhcR with UshA esterase domain
MTEEVTNKYIKISESDDETNEPLIQTQDMLSQESNDNQNNNNIKIKTNASTVEKVSTEEWLDQMNDNNMPKVIHNSKILSQQEMVIRSDEWKGTPVVNYKTFRKYSQTHRDSNQINSSSIELVRLKKYDNPYYKDTNSQNTRKH